MSCVKCPTCSSALTSDHTAFRGIVVNAVWSLRANLMSSRTNLKELQKRRINKSQPKAMEQTKASIVALERSITNDETALAGLLATASSVGVIV